MKRPPIIHVPTIEAKRAVMRELYRAGYGWLNQSEACAMCDCVIFTSCNAIAMVAADRPKDSLSTTPISPIIPIMPG